MANRLPRDWLLCAFVCIDLIAGAAQAGDAECVWKGIPQSYRDAFLSTYPAEGPHALARLDAPGEVLGPVMIGCGVKTHAQNMAAVSALMAYAFDEAASQVLTDKFGRARAQIDAAWDALPPASRDAFTKSVLTGAENGMPASSADPQLRQTAVSVVQTVAAELKVDDPTAFNQIGLYLTWKIARPFYEAKF